VQIRIQLLSKKWIVEIFKKNYFDRVKLKLETGQSGTMLL
jgi:hypothetical protein